MRILHVIPSVAKQRGGPSKAIIQMVAAQRDLGIDAVIASSNEDGSQQLDVPLDRLTEHQGVPIIFFSRWHSKIAAVREFTYSSSFKTWIRLNIREYDVIHIHAIFSFFSSYAMYQARLNKVPYIVRTIGQLEHWSLQQSKRRKNLFLGLFERKNIESASAIHFTSESEHDQALQRFPSLKGHVIPLGIDPPVTLNEARQQLCDQYELEENQTILLFLGRLHEKKGIEPLLYALSQTDSHPYLLIAGNGEEAYTQKLLALTASLGLSETCKFVGFKEGHDKTVLLQGADLFALTSYSENFGIAVLEAMAHGTAPFISDGVALSKAVEENKLGWVTVTDPTTIAQKIEPVLLNRGLLESTGQRAKSYVAKHYRWDAICKELLDLYKSTTQRLN